MPLTELTWQDVVSPDQLNARRFPVVLYAGYEDYRQSVAAEGDVDRSLIRYLEEGGLLVALPGGPFPFFYNEKHTAVNTAHRLGLPVGSGNGVVDRAPTGWEKPPQDLSFHFQFNVQQMPNLPVRVPFPKAGDIRWRPITNSGLKAGDVYTPLATLTDQTGRYWGDGIAYVEHHDTPPQGGKGIYVWMRMPELTDQNQLLFDVFRLAAEKAGIAPRP